MKRIAIIPARGGSKRLPRKNILEFYGRPIISYTIQAAIDTNLFDRVVVSTDDKEIADVAAQCGAHVYNRPRELASDNATVVEVCADLIAEEMRAGREYGILCCCYATAPLRKAEDIIATVSLLEPEICDYAIAVTDFIHYAYQALRIENDRFVVPMWPELAGLREEKVGKLLAGNGSTYAAFVPAFMNTMKFLGPKTRYHHMPFHRSIDIDTFDDFKLALAVKNYF